MNAKRKLSELIREGAKLRPQCRESFFDGETATKDIHSCALGAAFEAATGKTDMEMDGLDGFMRLMVNHCEIPPEGVLIDVVHMNDDDRETREVIADWLESEGF